MFQNNVIQKSDYNSISVPQKLGSTKSAHTKNEKLLSNIKTDLLKTNAFSERVDKNTAFPENIQNSDDNSVALYASSYSSTHEQKFADCFDASDSKIEYAEIYYGVKPKKGQSFIANNSEEDLNRKLQKNIDNRRDSCSKSFAKYSIEKSKSENRSQNIVTKPELYRSKKNFNSKHSKWLQEFHSNSKPTSSTKYKRCVKEFSTIYFNWLETRKDTLEKLKMLVHGIHNDQLEYNKTQKSCREIGLFSRKAKIVPLVGFVASVSAFLSDAASGIVSVAQAINVDSYQEKFQEIMECDEKVTKVLYEARSQSIAKYRGIEEVTRKFHFHTLTSTMNEISTAANAHDSRKMNVQECKIKIGDSMKTYVEENPAALEVCKSASRAVVGVIDSLGIGKNRNYIGTGISVGTNQWMMLKDTEDIDNLKSTIDMDLTQSKLETKIEDAICTLESEMEEFIEDYKHCHMPSSSLTPDYESESDYDLHFQQNLGYISYADACDSYDD